MEAFIRVAQLPKVAKYRAKISYLPVNNKELLRKTTLRTFELPEDHFTSGDVTDFTPASNSTGVDQDQCSISRAFEGTHSVIVRSFNY